MKPERYSHFFILFSVTVWGATFVSTKVLLNSGLNPSEIFVLRFLLAYLLMSAFAPKKLWADSKKDELLLLCAGMTGGSLYFLTENTALRITLASSVSLIICTTPLLTAICSHFFVKRERFRRKFAFGSLTAMTGVALVVCNGQFVLKITPLGDLLTLAAALMWALYNVFVKRLDKRYSTAFITRKVFAYGLLTGLPAFLFEPFSLTPDIVFRPAVIANILFLGIIASMLCFAVWNVAVKHLGAVRSSNYLYLNPVITLLTSAAVLSEPVTPVALVGAGLIIGGVYLAK